jgi:hypothetical protein
MKVFLLLMISCCVFAADYTLTDKEKACVDGFDPSTQVNFINIYNEHIIAPNIQTLDAAAASVESATTVDELNKIKFQYGGDYINTIRLGQVTVFSKALEAKVTALKQASASDKNLQDVYGAKELQLKAIREYSIAVIREKVFTVRVSIDNKIASLSK